MFTEIIMPMWSTFFAEVFFISIACIHSHGLTAFGTVRSPKPRPWNWCPSRNIEKRHCDPPYFPSFD